ncbi:MAG: GNAT family N-acetyltransferase [Chloroflexi bacterium]|nr:GNAT family N-acetyltransferase [Chloroflexota bacterium]
MTDLNALFDVFPVLGTSRLVLRPIRPSDAQAVYDIFSNTAVTRYYDQPTYTEMSQAERLISRMRQRFAERRTIRWAIARQTDDWLLGTCGYNDWKRHFNCAGVGYELGQAFWRQGIMTEVLTAVLQFGFNQMQLNRVEAYVMRGNTPSMNLLQRLNFQEEGVLREYGYWGRTYHDLHLFALLKRDFNVDN